METFSALLAICAGNSPVPGEFPTQRPVPRSFDVYFNLRPNKRLSKQSWGWWFEMPSRPLWRHRNVFNYFQCIAHSMNAIHTWRALTTQWRPLLWLHPIHLWHNDKAGYHMYFEWQIYFVFQNTVTVKYLYFQLLSIYPKLQNHYFFNFNHNKTFNFVSSNRLNFIAFFQTLNFPFLQ